MASKTQYAKLTVQSVNGTMVAVITTTDTGRTARQTLTPGRQPGWRLTRALQYALGKGWETETGSTNWYIRDGVETRNIQREVELCPNGQTPDECQEIDPCEACWEDENVEGDLIEESMGLR